MNQTKPFKISKNLVYEAYKRVKSNKGSAGVDGESLTMFERDLKNNLYKLWNRLSSGSYQPPPVKRVEIEKTGGGTRPLGIPTVTDRIAQMVVKLQIEPGIDCIFHPNSYGYRPNHSARQALKCAQKRCTTRPWVLDMDIKGFFDTINHELLMKAVRCHVKERWHLLYIERWITAGAKLEDGRIEKRHQGTPQGGVISPLLANLYLHYVFDKWIETHWAGIQFERYADDIVCHCTSEREAKALKSLLEKRFGDCGLTLHPEKTKIVYCKSSYHRGDYRQKAFDFLGYTFKPSYIKTRKGEYGLYFIAVPSQKSAKAIRDKINGWPWKRWVQKDIVEIRRHSISRLRGWLQYYGVFGLSGIRQVLSHFDNRLARWAKRKYKKVRGMRQAKVRIRFYRERNPRAFPHWSCSNGFS